MLQRRTGGTSGTTHDGPGVGGVGVGKQTLVQQLEATAPPARPQPVVQRKTDAAPGDMWQQTFGEDSAAVGKLGRVQAAKGVNLLARPTPGAASTGAPVPFNGLVRVERNTTQAKANQRWCYVIATDSGAAGFCEERYLAIDPPEPTATLRRTAGGERLATIAAEAYGAPTDDSNSRMQVQALYIANRDRAGVTLDQVELGATDTALRGDAEEQTLKIYKGAKVVAGDSLWIPSKAFIEQLKVAGAITGGSTIATQAWDTAKASRRRRR